MSHMLDIAIAIALTQSIGLAIAPPQRANNAPKIERSVWTGYTGLYKLQRVSEDCSRLNICAGIKAQLTWASVLHDNKVTINKENENVSR